MAPTPPWSDLPQEILTTIANFLTSNPLDSLAFRSVCKSWNSSAPPSYPILSPPLPLLFLSPPDPIRHRYSTSATLSCVLSATVIYSFRPPAPAPAPAIWVGFFDQLNNGKVSLRQPLCYQSFSTPSHFQNLNLSDLRVVELGRFYNLTALDDCISNDNSKPRRRSLVIPKVWSGEAVKVVLLSDMSAAVTLSCEGWLGLLRFGLGLGEEWEVLHCGKGSGFRFDDIIRFKGRVLGVDRRGKVYDIGLDSSSSSSSRRFITDLDVPAIKGGGGRRKRLVESLGELYLVVRCNNAAEKESVAFKVYRLWFVGKSRRKWSQVSEFGGAIFLFGIGFSLSVSAQELGGGCLKGNCIVFKDQSFWSYEGDDDDDDLIFGELGRNDLLVGVCQMENVSHIGNIGSYPAYLDLLWPPPSWIWPCHSKDRGPSTVSGRSERYARAFMLSSSYIDIGPPVVPRQLYDCCAEEMDKLRHVFTKDEFEWAKRSILSGKKDALLYFLALTADKKVDFVRRKAKRQAAFSYALLG